MKCIILCAGYATRLYPLTENYPKPLLKVGDKTILDWLLSDLETTKKMEEYILVSNHKFAKIFEEWAKNSPYNIRILDDGSTENDNRIGAVKDINFAVKTASIEEDCLVIAGDNVLDFSLSDFLNYGINKNASCVMRYFEPSEEKLKKCGVLTIGDDDRILKMVEKPQNPESHFVCPPFYFYKKADLDKINTALNEGCSYDAPGSFVSWLCQKTKVYAMAMTGSRYDIGNKESYENVQKIYKGIKHA